MKRKLPDQKQAGLFELNLYQIVNPAHELVLLAGKIEWEYFDHEFSSHYSYTGKPSMSCPPCYQFHIKVLDPEKRSTY